MTLPHIKIPTRKLDNWEAGRQFLFFVMHAKDLAPDTKELTRLS